MLDVEQADAAARVVLSQVEAPLTTLRADMTERRAKLLLIDNAPDQEEEMLITAELVRDRLRRLTDQVAVRLPDWIGRLARLAWATAETLRTREVVVGPDGHVLVERVARLRELLDALRAAAEALRRDSSDEGEAVSVLTRMEQRLSRKFPLSVIAWPADDPFAPPSLKQSA